MDSMVGLFYEIESRRFKNVPDEKRIYGWRDDIGQQTVMFDQPQSQQQTERSDGMPFDAPTDDDAPF